MTVEAQAGQQFTTDSVTPRIPDSYSSTCLCFIDDVCGNKVGDFALFVLDETEAE